MTVKAHVKQGIGLIIFGLLLPTALFFKAYPGGPVDMLNRILYQHQLTVPGSTFTVELGKAFSYNDDSYAKAVNILGRANEGDRVILVIRENFGGNAAVLEELSRAMGASRATVLVRLEHFGLSCGTYVLNDSDYTFIPNDSLILFHYGTYNGVTIEADSTDPVIQEVVQDMDKFFIAYRPWVTDTEYAQIRVGTDIFLTGKDICSKSNGRNPPVLYHTSDGCVIKGTRRV